MTAQMHDKFVYKKNEHYISAIEHTDTFIDINSLLGFEPRSFSTACRRGYVATFALLKEKLVLKKLYTNNGNKIEKEIPKINNKLPEISVREGLIDELKDTLRDFTYKNINLKILYTGSIIITKDFIRERYVHMGFQSPLSYNTVIQLTFNNGQLIAVKDFSGIAKSLREGTTKLPENVNNERTILQWVNDCFDLSYSKKAEGMSKEQLIENKE
jgi:hypothetical protein